MIKAFVIYLVIFSLTGCVSLTVDKAVGLTPEDEICIIDNPSVRKDFVSAYQASFEKLGYKASIQKLDDGTCLVTSMYSASYGMH